MGDIISGLSSALLPHSSLAPLLQHYNVHKFTVPHIFPQFFSCTSLANCPTHTLYEYGRDKTYNNGTIDERNNIGVGREPRDLRTSRHKKQMLTEAHEGERVSGRPMGL